MGEMAARLAIAVALAAVLLPARQPNILMIVSDDQGYMDLASMGSPDILTPRLDQLAADGARLTSYYAAFPVCTPSRAALLTGRYPQRLGWLDLTSLLSDTYALGTCNCPTAQALEYLLRNRFN